MAPIEDEARSIFLDALARDPDEWPAFLEAACGDHPDLRARVDQLLQAHLAMGSISGGSAEPSTETLADAGIAEGPGAVIGPYKLLEPIGEGGFGVVFLAEQTQPVRRKVALKILKPGMDTRQVVARFEAERQALAIMDHPNIAKVFDAGATPSGRPYFVMELVKGTPITEFCDANQLTPRQRLELFAGVCQAVQHAHQKGIIHRDLKPSNVLVSRHDTTPIVKVIDFGVAKALGQELTEKTLFTGIAQMIGTPLYMSPEQAGMSDLDVDTRSDIYSLGVLLYELLTGTTPFTKDRFKKAAFDEIRRIIREEEPPTPSTRLSDSKESLASISAQRQTEPARLTKLVRGELDWIVMKCLEKDRNRRYATASGLAADVHRYLADEPVRACPPSAGYRFRKFARRNRGPVVAASAVALCLVAGIIGTTAGMVWAVRERDEKATALAAETKARAGEQQARDKAMAALQSMTDEVVDTQMTRAETLTPENKEFLRKIIKHYEGLAGIAADDVESRAVRADGHFRVGLLLDRLGELKDAERSYADSLALYKQLAAEEPTRSSFREGVARSQVNLGILFKETGRMKLAEESYVAALPLRKQLAAEFSNRPEYRRALAQTHANLGTLFMAIGPLKEAETHNRAALELCKQLVADFPALPELRQELALVHDNLGQLYSDLSRFKEAVEAHAAGIDVQRRLVADFPTRPEYRRGLARSQFNLGRLHRSAGSEPEAAGYFTAALATQKQLAADFPSQPDYRYDLARSQNALGAIYHAKSQLREAETAFRAALELAQQLAVDFPTRSFFREEVAATNGNLGCVIEDLGRPKEAEQHYLTAIALYQKLAADVPDQPDFRNELASALGNLAFYRLRARDFQAAKAGLLECLPHHDAVLTANPREPTYRQFYRNTLLALVQANAGLGDVPAAKQFAHKLHDLGWAPPADAYDAACTLSLCIPIVQKNDTASQEERHKQVALYGDESMAMLRDAVAKGFKNADHIRQDKDLDPIRGREDFKKLLADLEAKKQ